MSEAVLRKASSSFRNLASNYHSLADVQKRAVDSLALHLGALVNQVRFDLFHPLSPTIQTVFFLSSIA